ncbi:MAG: Phenylacetic acid catabolic protein [Conexibacter sp.]
MSTTTPATAQETMISLVGSLADNKAALGRCYADWAVSAPTLESAVAAAAMAQDELGHARSTYPVLKALGVEDAEVDAARRLALLDDGLADWTSLIAANMLVDAVLTTFVAACTESSVEAMASRARKILQEEGSHRVHAEAWAKRLCRGGGAARDELVARLRETWEQAGHWAGPDDDAGFAAALREGMVGQSPAAQREVVRTWVRDLLAAEGVELELPEPTDWSKWDPARRRRAA